MDTDLDLCQTVERRDEKGLKALAEKQGNIALFACIQAGWLEGVEILLELGISLKSKTPSKNSALHFAARRGDAKLIELLLKNQSEPMARNSAQQTPLMYAAAAGNSHAVKILLKCNDSKEYIQATDATGRAALQLSCAAALLQPGHEECIQLLLAAGSNPNKKDSKGKSALSIIMNALPKFQSDYNVHHCQELERISRMLETSHNSLEKQAEEYANKLLEQESCTSDKKKQKSSKRKLGRTPPKTINTNAISTPRDDAHDQDHTNTFALFKEDTHTNTAAADNEEHDQQAVSVESQWFKVDRKSKSRRSIKPDPTESIENGTVPKESSRTQTIHPDSLEELYQAGDPQRLFQALFPEASVLALRIEDILLPTPSLSASQLEATYDFLSKCMQRTLEVRGKTSRTEILERLHRQSIEPFSSDTVPSESSGTEINHTDSLEQLYRAGDTQRLFERLFPEASVLKLRLEDILLPTPSLSASQLDATYDFLFRCRRRVAEVRREINHIDPRENHNHPIVPIGSGTVPKKSSCTEKNHTEALEQLHQAGDAQRLFERLFPEASVLALRLEDILVPTPSLSASQLEATHDILDKCMRRVIEARILLAVEKEKCAIEQALYTTRSSSSFSNIKIDNPY